MFDPEHGSLPLDADVSVEMFEWDTASAPLTIGTYALGPCTGIALYNKATKEGYVGHFVDPKVEADKVETMVSEALQGASPDDLHAWVRGCGLDVSDEANEDLERVEAARGYVADMFEQFGIDNPDIDWLESTRYTADMILDCSTGEFTSEVYSWDDGLDFEY